ncbi:class III lanthionine synthetase LanKC [Streptomyces sp. NPDC004610]|uniref:class III lanthionine synthetase LanKC n=1 Tax=unclassified Streptomyces TaxID=2593676 RepID=UPI0033B78F6B
MNPEYAAYCQTDGDFYDTPSRTADAGAPDSDRYEPARTPVPDGWLTTGSGDWLSWVPAGVTLPEQGWKIHVAAATDNAASVLGRVHAHCLAHRVPHKFVPGPRLLKLRNAKYAERAGSGKFITVYPADEESFERLCQDLAALLDGEHGPYILSDLRIGAGPVHVRYGAFAARYCLGADGRPVPAVQEPGGTLVPDPRGPSFTLPDWVTPPAFLRPHLDARAAVAVHDLPYDLQGALHFSNGGGVYLARDTRTGDTVVLKEARPHAGLGTDGADAVTRLDRERTALEQLAGLDCVPRVLDSFGVGDHRFLALEHIPGRTLNTAMVRRFPLSRPAPVTQDALADYTAWAEDVHARVEAAVAQVHARGLVFSDLHMSNIMVDEDTGRVVLLDFEAAFPIEEEQRTQVVANPAFVAPADHTGRAIDAYALACLRLALFLPLTTLFMVDRDRAPRLAQYAAETFPVPPAALAPAVREILRGTGHRGAEPGAIPRPPGPESLPEAGDWPRSRDSMARALAASATPDRPDRCFPGDIAQFANPAGGQCFGHGAAGVLYALHETGAPGIPEAVEWLLDRVKSPAPGTPPGFHDGLAGIAWTLHRLGHPAQAAELAQLLIRQPLDRLGPDLHGGLAGIALALYDLGEATGDPALTAAADRCAARAAHTLTDGPPSPRTGLLHGATGIALMCVRRHEATGDPVLLDHAATALRRDLDRCKPAPGGGLHVVEGRRLMPYLGAGSAGVALVLDDYLAHRPDDAPLAAARRAIDPALRSAFYIQPALYRGIGGLVLHLARTRAGDPGERRRVLDRHIRLMGLEATPYAGELAFPGEQLMRRSMDLATGTAGCLLALGAALAATPVGLPFLPPLPPLPSPPAPPGAP